MTQCTERVYVLASHLAVHLVVKRTLDHNRGVSRLLPLCVHGRHVVLRRVVEITSGRTTCAMFKL